MISSLDGKQFEPVVVSDLDDVLSHQELHRIPTIDDNCDIIVHSLQSARNAVQTPFFILAFSLIAQHVPTIYNRMKFESLINKEIRDRDMRPQDVVNWLLSSHIHIIYSHVHQGNIAINVLVSLPN